jgi:hypothetical protein
VVFSSRDRVASTCPYGDHISDLPDPKFLGSLARITRGSLKTHLAADIAGNSRITSGLPVIQAER